MDSILTIFHLLVIGSIVILGVRRLGPSHLRLHGYISFILKAAAGFALGYYYWEILPGGGDTFAYHEEAKLFASWGRDDLFSYVRYLLGSGSVPFESTFPYSPRAQWLSKWVSLVYLTGPGTYWLASLYSSLLAWAGLWVLCVSLIRLNQHWKYPALLSLMYFPSVLFWSSGLTKESFAVGALAMIVTGLLLIKRKSQQWHLVVRGIMILLFVIILWKVKYYYASVLALALLTSWILLGNWSRLKLVYRLAIFIISVTVLWLLLGQLNQNIAPENFPEVVYELNQIFVQKSMPGRFVELPGLCPEWSCLLFTFPYAALAGIYLPLPFEAWNKFALLTGLENCILILLTITNFLSLLKRWQLGNGKVLMLAGWIYCILLAAFLAMSAPNYGTLIRYRSGLLPFFLLLITLNNGYFCSWKELIRTKISRLLK